MIRTRLLGLTVTAALCGASLGLSACGNGGAGGAGGAGGEGPGSSASSSSGGDDAGISFPKPEVAGTADTDPLASAPAACGQPAYTWLKSTELGHITAHTAEASYTKDLLQTLLIAAKVTVPI